MLRVRLTCMMWLLLLAAPASALTPMEYTRVTLERASAIMGSDAAHDVKLAELSVLFKSFLDTDSMARTALGNYWSAFTPAQRSEFLTLFHVLIERAYVQKLMLFESPQFTYVGEARLGPAARVSTRIVTPGDAFSVVYQLRPEHDRWMATSITVEGINLTANYATQFNRLLSHSSVEDVLALMRRKYGKGAEARK